MRLLVYQLRPLALAHEGLIGALQARLDSVEKRAGVEARFLIEGGLGNLSPAAEEGLFRIAQEALNNATRHAHASRVCVHLEFKDRAVTLVVEDNGRGFVADEILGLKKERRAWGLLGMKERVSLVGGNLHVDSELGRGTRLTVDIPLMITEGEGVM